MNKYIFIFFSLTGFYSFCIKVQAQKLPNIQPNSVRAPADIKIDGKGAEWNNQYQAYNHATGIFYTLSNDNENLYLAIEEKDPDIIRKIVIGGITFTINGIENKTNNNVVGITFPTYDKKNHPLFIILSQRPEFTADTLKSRLQADSFMRACNQQLTNKYKIIGVTGIKAVTDSIISIYNEEGIKAVAAFDHQINYTYELAIPLEKLGLAGNMKFRYNIKLNGETASGTNMKIYPTSRGDVISFTGSDGIDYNLGKATPQNLSIATATDFSGEYTLAKKP